MTDLVPCTACHRHVALVERLCPFCATELPLAERRAANAGFGRLSRAAVFAGAALATTACGGKKKPDTMDNNNNQTATVDAAVEQAPPPPPDQVDTVKPDHIEAKPYGAPPARRRLV
jgi:hypothetical protein